MYWTGGYAASRSVNALPVSAITRPATDMTTRAGLRWMEIGWSGPGSLTCFSFIFQSPVFYSAPYKGDCHYYSIPAGGKKSVNAVWSYDDPFPAVAQIRGHVAFYPERVDEISDHS